MAETVHTSRGGNVTNLFHQKLAGYSAGSEKRNQQHISSKEQQLVYSYAAADRILTNGEQGSANLILPLASALLTRV